MFTKIDNKKADKKKEFKARENCQIYSELG
jgi:hypothetical protein